MKDINSILTIVTFSLLILSINLGAAEAYEKKEEVSLRQMSPPSAENQQEDDESLEAKQKLLLLSTTGEHTSPQPTQTPPAVSSLSSFISSSIVTPLTFLCSSAKGLSASALAQISAQMWTPPAANDEGAGTAASQDDDDADADE